MIREKLVQSLTQAVADAQQQGLFPPTTLPEATVERPQNPKHGDYASSLPLRLARATSLSPLVIAESLVKLIPIIPEVDNVVIAPPGFINFTLKPEWLTRQVDLILNAGDSYGNISLGNKAKVQLEFVSVNPTGPLHVGHGRGAVLGSTLANVLAAASFSVEKEYYVNDPGSQMDVFYRSLYVRYQHRYRTLLIQYRKHY